MTRRPGWNNKLTIRDDDDLKMSAMGFTLLEKLVIGWFAIALLGLFYAAMEYVFD